MKDTNRRSFIVGAGGSAAAAAATTVAFAAPAHAASLTDADGIPERLVAWVDDRLSTIEGVGDDFGVVGASVRG